MTMRRTAKIKLSVWIRAIYLLGLACALTFATSSVEARSRTIFDMLFGERQSQPPQPQYFPQAPRQTKPKTVRPQKQQTPPAARRTPTTAAPAPSTSPASSASVVEKKADARTVLIVGDFIGGGLAEGLGEAFADNPDIKIVSRTNGSSGFVRDDHFDWPANIGALIRDEKPAAIVVMIGANDRQAISIKGTNLTPRSPEWTAEYQRRVDNFIKTISDSHTPLVWVGQPPFMPRGMSQDILALNELYRATTEKAGGDFADVWDGFIDEDGNFTLSGFDINGETARLRANDGINITRSGKRKLAFYVEKPLRKALGGTGAKGEELPVVTPEKPATKNAPVERLAPVSLRDIDNDKSGVLLGGVDNPPAAAPAAGNASGHVSGNGPVQGLSASSPGRADDFSWPRKADSSKP